ncbi:hypothetical protein Cgig2_003031 [Carnegiea gigantea]|uniref:Uncharacterized protein n=1 Tax=Carnegiea gigantea TaxID=171969 RepID=A0A9Q1K5B0_9CARY|nr:hypothetical protein Cgig2_003031 [Carnegiea gigantea]
MRGKEQKKKILPTYPELPATASGICLWTISSGPSSVSSGVLGLIPICYEICELGFVMSEVIETTTEAIEVKSFTPVIEVQGTCDAESRILNKEIKHGITHEDEVKLLKEKSTHLKLKGSRNSMFAASNVGYCRNSHLPSSSQSTSQFPSIYRRLRCHWKAAMIFGDVAH